LQKTLQIIRPSNIVVFTDHPQDFIDMKVGMDIIFVPVAPFPDWQDVSIWAMTELHLYANLFREYVMSIHWDGFPINEGAWFPEFMEYDFIGAPWPDGEVGNDGFSIMSKRIILARGRLGIKPTKELCHPADALTLHKGFVSEYGTSSYWPRLEALGIRKAPAEVARRFSAEDRRYTGEFGFHGKMVLTQLYQEARI